MICEIINPSDPYTLVTDNFLAAAIGILLVGNGKLGLRCEDPARGTPVLFGWEEWLKEQGIPDLGVWLDEPANTETIAAALETVLIGNAAERSIMEDALAAIEDPAKREAFRAKQHDKRRSSLNDIGTACWKTAAALRKRGGKITKAEPIIVAQ